MGFDTIVRSGVALANSLTASLQVTVTHEAWTGNNVHGKHTYAAPISRLAIVEHKQLLRRTRDATVTMVEPSVLILEPVDDNGATGRKEPIDPRDRITLPDGRILTQLLVEMVMDPETNRPYMYMVTGEV